MDESMLRRPAEDCHTSREEQRRPRGPAGPDDQSERPALLGTEQELNRHQPMVEPGRSPPSEHSHYQSEALPSVKPKTSRLARPIAPPRPDIAARPVVSTYKGAPTRDQLRDRIMHIREGNEGGDDPPSDNSSYLDSSDEYDSWRHDPTGRPPNEPGEDPDRESGANEDRIQSFRHAPVHFRTKLSPEIIPEWNGNTTELSNWIVLINNIAEYSNYMRIQLGQQVPLRFTDRALRWFNALDKTYRRQITVDWPSLRRAISIHFMNRTFMERNKSDALYTKFHDQYHPQESLEDYIIRKMEALTILSDWTNSELITEIMNSAPDHWALYIDTSVVNTWDDFLDKVAWHEDKLLQYNGNASSKIQQQLDELKTMLSNLEIDENPGSEEESSDQGDSEDPFADAYTKDNQSETNMDSAENDSYKTLNSFATFVSTYSPDSADEA
ncbi:hypothetical protein FRC11_006968, partial [Ceratobasidium sp. 423]